MIILNRLLTAESEVMFYACVCVVVFHHKITVITSFIKVPLPQSLAPHSQSHPIIFVIDGVRGLPRRFNVIDGESKRAANLYNPRCG